MQWSKALEEAGFKLETDARTVVNSRRDIQRKHAVVAPKRNKDCVYTICNNHWWLVGYKGPFTWEDKRPFGFMDKTATLRNNVLLENPTIPAVYRLADQDGAVLNPYEKHMAEGVEMLTRFVGRNEPVLDFCAGTCSLGLASLYLNQRYCVLNDRDKNQLQYAEARLRAYLWAMVKSPLWLPDDSGDSTYTKPGMEARDTWDGRDPYLPLLCALRVEQIHDKIAVPTKNAPSGVDMAKMAALYNCEVEEDGGVFLTESTEAGFCFPIYGDFRRSPGNLVEGQISSVILRPQVGERKAFYMRVSTTCPWRFVRAPGDDEEANCCIQENRCDMQDLAKVVLKLLVDVHVNEGDRVELLCKYDL